MAIIYTFPKITGAELVASDLLLLSKMNQIGRPTKSVRLEDLKEYINPGGGGGGGISGSGTIDTIPKWNIKN